MQTVKIKTIDDLTHVFIGDHELKHLISIAFNQSPGTVPCFTFETVGIPDIEIDNSVVRFKFTPETIRDAAKVIQHSFSTDKELYNTFVASIASALKELPRESDLEDVARAVADRIIGRNND